MDINSAVEFIQPGHRSIDVVEVHFSPRPNGRYSSSGVVIVADNELVFVVTGLLRGGDRVVARLGYDGMTVSESSNPLRSTELVIIVPGNHMNVSASRSDLTQLGTSISRAQAN